MLRGKYLYSIVTFRIVARKFIFSIFYQKKIFRFDGHMTGLIGIIYKNENDPAGSVAVKELFLKIRHRGVRSQYHYNKNSIEILVGGNQKELIPHVVSADFQTDSILALDGHVYNADVLKTKYGNYLQDYLGNYEHFDAAALLAGYRAIGIDVFREAIGSFSGILKDGDILFGFKDPVGAKPLYACETDSFLVMASELKAVSSLKGTIFPINPGHVLSSRVGLMKYLEFPAILEPPAQRRPEEFYTTNVHALVKKAVSDNIHPDEQVCALLSGGIDSAIVVSVAKDLTKDLHVYTVAVEGSRDLINAKNIAQSYNLTHTILKITLEDLLESLPDVIWALETFDAALIRSAIPMFLISKKISEEQNPDVVLTGEGGDELFGGYDYLKSISDEREFNQELLNLLEIEHKTGLQRVDRIPYHFSMEARAPLFDRRLVELALQVPVDLKIREVNGKKIEKYVLRKAFEKDLPAEIVWRAKEKFSQGVGSQFLLRDYFQKQISDEDFEANKQITPAVAARSKEELHYWRIFESEFHPTPATVAQLGLTSYYEI